MPLSDSLVSQFVKATKEKKQTNVESTVYGTTVEYNGSIYVKLDGSDLLTPVSKTAKVSPDDRVTVMIKNHTATITGNITSPSASSVDVDNVANEITEFEIVMSHKVTTEELETHELLVEFVGTET